MAKPIPEFVVYSVDHLQVIGPVQARPMFGAYGIFLDNIMFGLVSDNCLYFKVDEISKSDFLEAGLQAFKYMRKGRAIELSYYQAPEEVFDSLETMRDWGNAAYAAALRSARQVSK